MADISWQKFANCKGMPVNDFFDNYMDSNEIQLKVDTVCSNCVVRKQCLEWAISEGLEGGVFGRKFLQKQKTKKKVKVSV